MSIIPSEERFAKYYKQNSEKDIMTKIAIMIFLLQKAI